MRGQLTYSTANQGNGIDNPTAAIPMRDQYLHYNAMQQPDTIIENGYTATFKYYGDESRAVMTVYLARTGKPYIITLIPAIFMTVVCTTFLVASPQVIGHGECAPWVALAVIVIAVVWFATWLKKDRKANPLTRN